MTDTQNTPTPWKTSTCGLGAWSGNEPPGANKIIANCDAVSRSKPENAANAGHIVKCVNLHDELPRALRAVVEMERDRDEESRNSDEDRLEYFTVLVARAGRPA